MGGGASLYEIGALCARLLQRLQQEELKRSELLRSGAVLRILCERLQLVIEESAHRYGALYRARSSLGFVTMRLDWIRQHRKTVSDERLGEELKLAAQSAIEVVDALQALE